MRAFFLALFALVAIASCDGVRADEGRDALLGVRNVSQDTPAAQFVRGEWPAEATGPAIKNVNVNPVLPAGIANRAAIGDLERPATAVAITLAGDIGYWIVPAGIPSGADQSAPTFSVELSIAAKTPAGPRDLVLRAIDRENRFGPPETRTLKITEPKVADGELVISLAWDNGADLDLHVVDPNGVEIFKRDINSYQTQPREPPNIKKDGGILDIDSNASCNQDARRAENVIWAEQAPKGRYVVRVDTFSMCGEPATRWRATGWYRGDRIAAAEGVSTENETRFEHNRGGGILALELDVR